MRSYWNPSRRVLWTRRHARHHRPRHGGVGPRLRWHLGLLRRRCDGDSDGVGARVRDADVGSAAMVRRHGRRRGGGGGDGG